jgi:hypothetical protein
MTQIHRRLKHTECSHFSRIDTRGIKDGKQPEGIASTFLFSFLDEKEQESLVLILGSYKGRARLLRWPEGKHPQ